MPVKEIRVICYYYTKTPLITTAVEKKYVSARDVDICEDVCIEICKQLKLKPLVQHLFGLRALDKPYFWVPPCRPLRNGVKYIFRLRFKLDPISKLKELCPEAYEYFYHQLRNDLIDGGIPNINYKTQLGEIIGFCVVDMYREALEKDLSLEELMKHYKSFVPKSLRKFSLLNKYPKREVKRILKNNFYKQERPVERDILGLKDIYVRNILTLSPDYLCEVYTATNMNLEIFPHKHLKSNKTPGLRFFTTDCDYNDNAIEIKNISNVMITKYTVVEIYLHDNISSRTEINVEFNDTKDMESFISCLAGYYRLMVTWYFDLCNELQSPSLRNICERYNNCHGPVSEEFSQQKLKAHGNEEGMYIVRQSQTDFNSFYIDIIINSKLETRKVLYENNQFMLENESIEFKDLKTLVESISLSLPANDKDKLTAKHVHIPFNTPTEEPKKIKILNNFQIKRDSGKGLIIPNDLLLIKRTVEPHYNNFAIDKILTFNGVWDVLEDEDIMEQRNVTIKELQETLISKYSNQFHDLVKKSIQLSKCDSIAKFYGLSLPNRLVFEELSFGPLCYFLKLHKEYLPIAFLIDPALSLTKALDFLQVNNFIHSRIRCVTIYVKSYEPNKHLDIKLGDPGLWLPYTDKDKPWIPKKYYSRNNVLDLQSAKSDKNTDIWAFGTTLWEMFNYGAQAPLNNDNGAMTPVPQPKNCKKCKDPTDHCNIYREVFKIMSGTWGSKAEEISSPMDIRVKLLLLKQKLDLNDKLSQICYTNIYTRCYEKLLQSISQLKSDFFPEPSKSSQPMSNNNNNLTVTYVKGSQCSTQVGSSNQSSLCQIDSSNCLNKKRKRGRYRQVRMGTVKKLKQLGKGNFGTVFKGEIITSNRLPVAIKQLKPKKMSVTDFKSEIDTLKGLDHDNIVKILDYSEEYPPWLIMELIEGGSLDKLLISRSSELTVRELLVFAQGIAQGMMYLEGMNLVHRDLAARNILVDSEKSNTIKITDFGLARSADEEGNYLLKSDLSLPFKWYAIEALDFQTFSLKSDVWSYGITMYEIFSLGKKPYDDEPFKLAGNVYMDKYQELIKRLKKGDRLQRPDSCPDEIYYVLMLPCWDKEPTARPKFSAILAKIDEMLSSERFLV